MIRKEIRRLSNAMLAGMWSAGLGVLVLFGGFWLMIFFGSPLTAAIAGLGGLGIFVGLALMLYTVFGGLKTERDASRATEAVQMPDCRVVARFAINVIGETLFSEIDIDFEDPKTRLLVRVDPGGGPQLELKTSQPVWDQCGEGMRGMAIVQGDWLAGFSPSRGSGEGDPYRK